MENACIFLLALLNFIFPDQPPLGAAFSFCGEDRLFFSPPVFFFFVSFQPTS
jgi:hypothetical protein